MIYASKGDNGVPKVLVRTILVAEDEDALRLLVERVLTRAGYRVIQARNGVEAASLWRAHSGEVDMLVTDVVMPHMDGPTLVREISADRADLKLLYMSGYNQDAVVQRGIAANSIAFLPKPFTPKELVAKVQQVLTSS